VARRAEATPEIVATIGGRTIPRSRVLAWEARRTRKVLRKLGLDAGASDLAAQRACRRRGG
jgi:hypothetical protein